jgi:hypothetical protein
VNQLLPIKLIRENVAHEGKLLLYNAQKDRDIFGKCCKYDLTEAQRLTFLLIADQNEARGGELIQIAIDGSDDECRNAFKEVHFGDISSGGPIFL